MDGPKSLNPLFLHRGLRGTALVLAAMVAGCLSPQPNFIFATSESAMVQLARRVSERRGLPLTTTLRIEIQGTGTDGARPQPTQYYGSVPIAQIESIYKDIGLVAPEVDFATGFAEYEKITQLSAYQPATGIVSLAREALQLGNPWENAAPAAARELPAVIGITQALQEQQFHWQQKIDASVFVDHRLSLRALAIGDALLVAVPSSTPTDNHKISPQELRMMLQIASQVERMAAGLPEFWRAQATFPYREGSQFGSWAYAAQGWQGVNALYENPPVTTAQVLHPEKYFIRWQPPLRFFPAALLRRDDNRSIAEQSLGEFSVRTLLGLTASADTAAETAAQWRGDQLFSFQTNDGIETFWFSAWENENAAKAFLRAYAQVLERRWGIHFDDVRQAKDATVIANDRDGRAWLLQARGPAVLALVTRSGDQLAPLAERAWVDLEIEPETSVIRFESAQRPVNFR